MLYYPSQQNFAIFGSKTAANVITESALTSLYTGQTKTFSVGGYSKLNLDVSYTMGAAESSNSVELKFECSPDGTNFYRIPNESVSGGTSTLTAREFTFVGANAANATISIGLDIFYKFIKISAKETGVAANAGTIFAEVTLSGQ
jgi:hypothetical protein